MSRQPHTRSTAQNPYGSAHQKRRAELKKLVDRGGVKCYRCRERIQPGQHWDLDHVDHNLAHGLGMYGGASHRHCNQRARNQRVAALARQAQGRGTAAGPEQPHTAPALAFFDTRTPNNTPAPTVTTSKPPAELQL
jgi:hypothetical protein